MDLGVELRSLGSSSVCVPVVPEESAFRFPMLRDPRLDTRGPESGGFWSFLELLAALILPLVSREWKNGSNSSYNCTPFLHSLLTKGK